MIVIISDKDCIISMVHPCTMSAVVVHAIIRLAACFVAKQICRKRKNESVDNRQIVVD